MYSPTENGLENCKENPFNTLPKTSLAAKAVATPAVHISVKRILVLFGVLTTESRNMRSPHMEEEIVHAVVFTHRLLKTVIFPNKISAL